MQSYEQPHETSTATAADATATVERSEQHVSAPTVSKDLGRRGLFSRVTGSAPTWVVLVLIAGFGYWGHSTGWSIPRFSHLVAGPPPAEEPWCAAHGVPEEVCVECQPVMFPAPQDYGWCNDHGIHQCSLDHPDIAQLKGSPDVRSTDLERAARALALRPRPENNPLCTSYRRRIQFATHSAAVKAGVDVEPVARGPITESITAPGEIHYDPTRVVQLSSKAQGTVWRVEKKVGDRVARGELLAVVDAAEVGRLKGELLEALAERTLAESVAARLVQLADRGITAKGQLQEAEAQLSKARIRVLSAQQALANLGLQLEIDSLRGLDAATLAARVRTAGLPTFITHELDSHGQSSNLLPIVAPLDGIVVSSDVVAGESVAAGDPLVRIANTQVMWLTLAVPMEEARYISLGQPVEFLPDGFSTPQRAAIDWISTSADPQTRTVSVRAPLANPDGRLLSETFGVGRIVLRSEPDAILVPNEAIQWDGSCQVVFVRDRNYFESGAPKLFHTRPVRTGARVGGVTEILAGVVPGEIIATDGSSVLRAELLKNNLGAGCACEM